MKDRALRIMGLSQSAALLAYSPRKVSVGVGWSKSVARPVEVGKGRQA